MQTLTRITELRSTVAPWRAAGERLAFVPTMGNLHAGHLHLIEQAKQHADRVVASIFVNPLQFGPNEDFSAYPRTFEEDSCKLTEHGVDALFAPSLGEIYPSGSEQATYVEVPGLSGMLCGAYRPGHFRGVATVVNKLFNIVQPQVALFGEKDYQQLQVIRRMVADLALPIEIVGISTVREPDGLALSSRNAYLSPAERAQAPTVYNVLVKAKEALLAGGRDVKAVESAGLANLQAAGFKPDYFRVCRAEDLAPAQPGDSELVILTAAWLGKARLIDNVRCALKPNA